MGGFECGLLLFPRYYYLLKIINSHVTLQSVAKVLQVCSKYGALIGGDG